MKHTYNEAREILGECWRETVETPIMEYKPAAQIGYHGYRPAGEYPSGSYTKKDCWVNRAGKKVPAV